MRPCSHRPEITDIKLKARCLTEVGNHGFAVVTAEHIRWHISCEKAEPAGCGACGIEGFASAFINKLTHPGQLDTSDEREMKEAEEIRLITRGIVTTMADKPLEVSAELIARWISTSHYRHFKGTRLLAYAADALELHPAYGLEPVEAH